MKQIERQDIKTMIDSLETIGVGDRVDYDIYAIINSTITMLEDLGNLVHYLQQENAKLKQDVLQLEAMIDD